MSSERDSAPRSDSTAPPTARRHGDLLTRITGGKRYTDDIKLPGMLHAKIVRSPHAHARIRWIVDDRWRVALDALPGRRPGASG